MLLTLTNIGTGNVFSITLAPKLGGACSWGMSILFTKAWNCREPGFGMAAGFGGGGGVNELGKETVGICAQATEEDRLKKRLIKKVFIR